MLGPGRGAESLPHEQVNHPGREIAPLEALVSYPRSAGRSPPGSGNPNNSAPGWIPTAPSTPLGLRRGGEAICTFNSKTDLKAQQV